MADDRTTRGPDVPARLTPSRAGPARPTPDLLLPPLAGPKRAALERELRAAVRSGRLAAGTRLPSTRSLAAELGVSRGVVVEAYEQLVAEGWLASRHGSGTVVADVAAAAAAGDIATSSAARNDAPPRWSFRPGVPDLSRFDRGEWLAATRRVLREVPDAALGYGDPAGPERARKAVVAYLGRVRGVIADADQVVLTSGMAQGLILAAAVLKRRGASTCAVEDPSHSGTRSQVTSAGLGVTPVPVDAHGLQADRLPANADMVLVTPAHQFPTGAVMAPDRRAALLAHGAYVFEDDYDAEFRYDREPVGALQPLAPDRVIHGGGASKTLAPALRLGWVVAPRELAGEIAAAKLVADHGSPALEQLTFAQLLETGAYDRHVRRARQAYRRRRDRLIAALAERLPRLGIEGIAAGLHLLATLPPETSEAAVIGAATARGLELHGMAEHRMTPGPPALVLGYGALPDAAIPAAVRALAAAIEP